MRRRSCVCVRTLSGEMLDIAAVLIDDRLVLRRPKQWDNQQEVLIDGERRRVVWQSAPDPLDHSRCPVMEMRLEETQ